MENIQDTLYNFALVLRQHYTEAILRKKLLSVGASYRTSAECVDFHTIRDPETGGSCGVMSYFVNPETYETMTFQRYALINIYSLLSGLPFTPLR